MILRPAGDLEPVPLDRVREDHRRPVGRLAGATQRLEDVGDVVAAEVPHEPRGVVGEQRRQPALLGRVRGSSSAARTCSSEAPNSAW